MNESKVLIWFLLAIIVCMIGGWVIASHFEASAFNMITGKDVSTWQAMWVNLRVQN